MIDKLKLIIDKKNLLILGFGMEGQSTYQLIRKYFPTKMIAIADADTSLASTIKLFHDINLKVVLGVNYLKDINQYDLIIKAPGVSLKDLKYVRVEKITSQTDIFLRLYREKVIGITGTKGKSTTSSLAYHVIRLFTDDVVLVGNIGVPPFDLMERIGENTMIVYELSSHQLEFISKAPSIAVLLNLFQEHLDHYNSLEDYHQAKLNILNKQKSSDFFVFNADDDYTSRYLVQTEIKRIYYEYSLTGRVHCGCYLDDNKVVFVDGSIKKIFDVNLKRQLKGTHNLANIMAVINVCKILEIPDDVIMAGIASFKGLEHRIEYVGQYDGIHFYNDSIATIPEATIQAVKALDDVDTLILGGYDRGVDYGQLVDFLSSSTISNLIFLDAAGRRILDLLNEKHEYKGKTFMVSDMQEALDISRKMTRKDAVCILSPAAASYGMFRNFEERGTTYKKIIRSW